jgi:UDP-N-acetylmuramoyl-tripeptide--D-alanyl-D-alanine ligase
MISILVGVLAMIVVAIIGMPFVVFLAHLVSIPLFAFAHRRLQLRAIAVRDRQKSLTVIAIVGSYGKTTTKNLLYEMIRHQQQTQLIEGNINTTAGIAQWMVTKFQEKTNVLIVEMDAYHLGEIAKSCAIVRPNHAILTSIGDQHLMRFGSQKKIVEALHEAFASIGADGARVCDAASDGVFNAHGYSEPREMVSSSSISAPHLSDSIRADAAFASMIAKKLGVPDRFIDEAIRTFVPPDRRQQASTMFGYEGIDDSYNISVPTARAGVLAAKEIAKQKGKKVLVLTAGIPELPQSISSQENAKYGSFLAENTDGVALLLSEHAADLRRGIEGRIPVVSAPNLAVMIPVMQKAFSVDEYVLLFQPELTDASY